MHFFDQTTKRWIDVCSFLAADGIHQFLRVVIQLYAALRANQFRRAV